MFDDFATVVHTIGDLPPVPAVAARVLELMQEPMTPVKALAGAIAPDPAVSARILKVANSVYYSQQREVATLDRAIVVLGENYTRNLVLETCLRSAASTFGALQRDIWEESLGCAIGARLLAEATDITDPGEAFLAGLFRHLGKLVMVNYDLETYGRVVEITDRGQWCLLDVERGFFAFSHEKVGAAVLDYWNFPETLVQTTLHHHDVSPLAAAGELQALAAAVNLAGSFCRHHGVGRPVPERSRPLHDSPGAQALGLSESRLDELFAQFRAAFTKERDMFLITA